MTLIKGEGEITEVATGWRLTLLRFKNDRKGKGMTVVLSHELFKDKWLKTKFTETVKWLRTWQGVINQNFINRHMRIVLGKNYHFHGCRHGRLQDLEDQGFSEEMLMKVRRWSSTHAMKFY